LLLVKRRGDSPKGSGLDGRYHWVERSNWVAKNFISQLASLFNEKARLYIQSFKGVHLQQVFRCLAELLQVSPTPPKPPARPAAHDASRLAAAPHSARLQPMRLAAGSPGWNGWMMAHQAMVILDETITQNNDLQSKWNM
jgi:hypothetical protein